MIYIYIYIYNFVGTHNFYNILYNYNTSQKIYKKIDESGIAKNIHIKHIQISKNQRPKMLHTHGQQQR